MYAPIKPLADDGARRTAIAIHDRSILIKPYPVEANIDPGATVRDIGGLVS